MVLDPTTFTPEIQLHIGRITDVTIATPGDSAPTKIAYELIPRERPRSDGFEQDVADEMEEATSIVLFDDILNGGWRVIPTVA